MAAPQLPDPVKLLVAILWARMGALQRALARLEQTWGPLDYHGEDHAFDLTEYYLAEMGEGLHRRLVAFRELVPPETLREAKLRCNGIEDELADGGKRSVNLDVGYLDHNKLVLASVKNAGQKIYLGSGIYADLIARYKGGRYVPFEWTFPDFEDGRYSKELNQIRALYLQQLRGAQLQRRLPAR